MPLVNKLNVTIKSTQMTSPAVAHNAIPHM